VSCEWSGRSEEFELVINLETAKDADRNEDVLRLDRHLGLLNASAGRESTSVGGYARGRLVLIAAIR
jgi:hypothetical protein